MSTVATYQAKTHFTDLVNRVAAGETITITRHGRPVARMVPCDFADAGSPADIAAEFRKLRQTVAKRGRGAPGAIKKLIRQGRRF